MRVTLLDRTLLLALSALRATFRILPFRSGMLFSKAFGRFCGHFFPRDRRVAKAQILFAQKSLAKKSQGSTATKLAELHNPEQLISDVFAHVGQTMFESLRLDALLERDANGKFLHVADEGYEAVLAALAGTKGILALSGHLGSIELLAAHAIAKGIKLSVVARQPNYRSLNDFLVQLRSSYGVDTIWRDDPNGGRRLARVLLSGGVLAALIDQDVGLANEFAPFFSLPAAYPVAPIELAIKLNTPIFAVFIVRDNSMHHTVHCIPLEYTKEDPDAAKHVLGLYSRVLEDFVCRYPEQWLWWHRRWRRRPGVDYDADPEALRSTDKYLQWMENDAKDS